MDNDEEQTRTAPLGAVLSLVTGVLVCPLDELYELQDFMTGSHLYTHERAMGENWFGPRDSLIRQFPALAEAAAPTWVKDEKTAREWVAMTARHVGWDEAEVRRAA